MRKFFSIFAILIFSLSTAAASSFDTFFTERTLRIDYIFSGNASMQIVALDELTSFDGWAGRRINLDKIPVKGNGELKLIDPVSKAIIYRTSFSSLFQEWVVTDEASKLNKSFEFTILTPLPKSEVLAEITLYDNEGNIQTTLTHSIQPNDKLIRNFDSRSAIGHEYIMHNGSPAECIDIAIMAEGYTAEEMDIFMQDARTACEEIFSYEPFASFKKRFNVVAVKNVSKHSNVSVPQDNVWRETAMNSNFMTFYSPRYLTTNSVHLIHDNLAGVAYEHLII